MNSFNKYFHQSFYARLSDRTLSSGIRKQLCCLIFVIFLLWGILYLIISISGIKGNELFPIETSSPLQNEQTEGYKQLSKQEQLPLHWTVYYHFIDPGNQHVVAPNARPYATFISLFGTIFLSGMLISTFSNILERRVDRYKKGLIRYRLSQHFVLIGYNNSTSYLIKQLYKAYPHSTVVIQSSRSIEDIRMELSSELLSKEYRNIVLLFGQRNKRKDIESLCVDKAIELFIQGESYQDNRAEYAHDSMNIDCLNHISCILEQKKRKEKLKCHVLFEYQTTHAAFQFSDLGNNISDYIQFHPYNFYADWAQKLFVRNTTANQEVKYPPLDRVPLHKESDQFVHLVIIGMSKMGVALATEAAHVAHYPNFITKGKRTKITMIDLNAEEEMNTFKSHRKCLFDLSLSSFVNVKDVNKDTSNHYNNHSQDNFLDIEWEFIQGDVAHPIIQSKITQWAEDKLSILTIAVCFNIPHKSLSCSFYLPRAVYDNQIPILVLQRDSTAIIKNISKTTKIEMKDLSHIDYRFTTPIHPFVYYENLYPFGMEDDCFDLTLINQQYAKAVMYTYEYYFSHKCVPRYLPSSKEIDAIWDKTKICDQWSNIYNANTIPSKLRSIGYSNIEKLDIYQLTRDEIQLLAEVEHNRWNVEKLLMGFRAFTKEEDKLIEDAIIHDQGKDFKREYKLRYIHYDIRPYSCLRSVEKCGSDPKEYDIAICEAIPLILKAEIQSIC